MHSPKLDDILEAIQSTEESVHRLVLIVGGPQSGKTSIITRMAEQLQTDVLNLNLELSQSLLEISPKNRPLQASKCLQDLVYSKPSPLLIDNTELLFDKNLCLEPLVLLQSISRNKLVLATWNGKFANKKLYYASPEHSEYREISVNDLFIVNLDNK